MVNGSLRSYAASLEVVAHELLHGLTDATARLEYRFQSGALNESYSDIFGVIVANYAESDVTRWDWKIGEDLTATGLPLRDMSDPAAGNQPSHMDDYRNLPEDQDNGGVHINSGIHNKAAFNILTAKGPDGRLLFEPIQVARLFYVTLVSRLSRNSEFIDSRRGVELSARSMLSGDDPLRNARLMAIAQAFDSVGIVPPEESVA
jgi:Zn-dependent metalloprotease